MKSFFAILSCLALFGGCAVEGSIEDAFRVRPDTDGVVRIYRSGGGDPYIYMDAAREVLKKGLRVQILGNCASACINFADMARPNVCIGPKAKFLFHQGLRTQYKNYGVNGMVAFKTEPILVLPRTETDRANAFDPELSPDLMEWVKNHGGFPFYGFLPMDASEALKFWPACP